MYWQFYIFIVVFIFFDGCTADNAKDDGLVELFRTLYKIDRKKHEEIRQKENDPRDKVREWLFSNANPEYRVLRGVNLNFQAIMETKNAKKPKMSHFFGGVVARTNQNLFDVIGDTEVMRRTIAFLKKKSDKIVPDLLHLWATTVNPLYHLFPHVFLADEKFDRTQSYIVHDKARLKTPLKYSEMIAQEIFVAPDVKIIKVKKGSKRKMESYMLGPSLELEMAMYTACFVLHPNENCEVALENVKFNLYTKGKAMDYMQKVYPVM